MIVGVCGFGSTGSSAVSDYLLEFQDVQVLDQIEFTWVSGNDGLVDLEDHIMHPHNRTSGSISEIDRYVSRAKRLERFYTKRGGISKLKYEKTCQEFIEEITQVSWNWYLPRKKSFINRCITYVFTKKIIPAIEKKKGRQVFCFPMEKVHLSMMPENFYEAARKHVSHLLDGLGADNTKIIVLDQPFSGNNPQACFPFFNDPYAIVTDRDPRDNYVFARTKLLGRNHFMAVNTVEEFVKYYRAMRDNQPYKQNHERILRIQFEDMIYRYNETTKQIRDFLHLGDNPKAGLIFDPSLSIRNTQVYKRFPQYADDVKYIEDNLTEYLFDFDQFGEIDISGEMFFGKSPLHK